MYGVTGSIADGCRNAIKGAAAMVARLEDLNRRYANDLPEPLRMGLGIHCGEVIVGTMGGSKVEVDLGALMGKRGRVHGTLLRARPLEEKAILTQTFARRWLPLFASGRLRAVVDRVYPLSEVAEAHRYMETNGNFGKIVLTHDE